MEFSVLNESVHLLPFGIAIYKDTGQCLAVNPSACDALDVTEKQFLSASLSTLFPYDQIKMIEAKAVDSQRHRCDFVIEQEEKFFNIVATTSTSKHIHVTIVDVTREQQLEAELAACIVNIKRLDDAVSGANLGCWDFYPQEKRIVANKTWVTQKKYQDDDFRENGSLFSDVINGLDKWSDIVHPDDLKPTMEVIEKHLAGETECYDATFRMICGDGEWRWIRDLGKVYERDEAGNAVRMNGVHVDITEAKNLERRIQELLHIDELTNVKNRRYFESGLLDAIKVCSRNNSHIAFALLDIDYFKEFNDTYGHQEGDNALIQLGEVINRSLKREVDTCFRLGGEEFAVIYEVDSMETALNFAQIIKESVEALKIPHRHNTASPYLTVSIGLYCRKADQRLIASDMYRMADSLLYRAKSDGKNNIKAI